MTKIDARHTGDIQRADEINIDVLGGRRLERSDQVFFNRLRDQPYLSHSLQTEALVEKVLASFHVAGRDDHVVDLLVHLERTIEEIDDSLVVGHVHRLEDGAGRLGGQGGIANGRPVLQTLPGEGLAAGGVDITNADIRAGLG